MCGSLVSREIIQFCVNQEGGLLSCRECNLTCCQLGWQLHPLVHVWEICLQALDWRQQDSSCTLSNSMFPVSARRWATHGEWIGACWYVAYP